MWKQEEEDSRRVGFGGRSFLKIVCMIDFEYFIPVRSVLDSVLAVNIISYR